MNDRRQCEFFLLRYVPDAVREEFVNIGVVLYTVDDAGPEFADILLTRDWRRVRCIDPEAELDVFSGIEQQIRASLASGGTGAELLQEIRDSFSGALQISDAKALLAESPPEEIQRLSSIYLERGKGGARAISGRQTIVQAMRREFERQGVAQFLRHNVSVAPYTYAGDPLKIDYSYRPNGDVKMFQAVSIQSDANPAKALAFSYPQVREGIKRVEKAGLELTAVVESNLDQGDEGVRFALHVLNEQEIRVKSIADLPAIAEKIRVDLRL